MSSNSLVPFNQIAEWTSCVSFFGVVSLIFGLLFQNILMKIVIKRLPDVCYCFSGFSGGLKSCDFSLRALA